VINNLLFALKFVYTIFADSPLLLLILLLSSSLIYVLIALFFRKKSEAMFNLKALSVTLLAIVVGGLVLFLLIFAYIAFVISGMFSQMMF